MRRRGFTLIEVLVALAIAAVGLAAVLAVVSNTARNAGYLRDKTVASWIGENRVTELRLAGAMPSVDKTGGELDYAGRHWKWDQVVTQTEVNGMRRIDVAVRLADAPADSALVTITGFVGATQLAAPPAATSWDNDGSAGGTPAQTPAPTPAPTLGGAR